MVMFHKNGQGYFDFDLKELAELTTIEFTKKVKGALDSQFVRKVVMTNSSGYVNVIVLTYGLIKELTFSKETKEVYVGYVTSGVLELLKEER